MTNVQLAGELLDFLMRYRSACQRLEMESQFNADAALIREIAYRLTSDTVAGHAYVASIINGVCRCGLPYKDHHDKRSTVGRAR